MFQLNIVIGLKCDCWTPCLDDAQRWNRGWGIPTGPGK